MIAALKDPVATFWRHRGLVRELTRREISSRFVGSVLGLGWIVLHPLALLGVYVLVFGSFRAGATSPQGGGEDPMVFVARLFVGIIVFGLFSETLNRAPKLVLARPNFVTKVRFPLEVLPLPGIVVSAIGFLVGILVLLVFRLVAAGGISATTVAVPFLVLPLVLLTLGLSWVLSAVGVFLRDLSEVVRVIVQLLFFLSPVVWTLDMISEEYRPWVLANPVALTIEWVRGAISHGTLPSAAFYGGVLAVAFVTSVVGLVFFRKTREGFADVL